MEMEISKILEILDPEATHNQHKYTQLHTEQQFYTCLLKY